METGPGVVNSITIQAGNLNINGTQVFKRDVHFISIHLTAPLRGHIFIAHAPRYGQEPADWLRVQLAQMSYAVSSLSDTQDWQAALSRAESLVVVLTSDSARDDSPISSHVRYARSQNKLVIVLRFQPGFTPVELITTPYLQTQKHRGAALNALLNELAHQPAEAGPWIIPGAVVWQSPEIFLGRQEIQKTFEHALNYLARDGRSIHLIYGRDRTGKTALLHRLREYASSEGAITLYADLDPLTMNDTERLPADEMISMLWAQLLHQWPDAQERIREAHNLPSALVWLYKAIAEVSQQKPVLLLIDNLHRASSGLIIDFLKKITGKVMTIATSLRDELTPEIEFGQPTRTYILDMLSPRELGLMFDSRSPDIETGREIVALTNGIPEVTIDMLHYWLQKGYLGWNGLTLERVTDLELPDLWAERIEAQLEIALDELDLPSEMEVEDLLDWLTCAAMQGSTFSEKVIFKALENEFPPEASAQFVKYLASAKYPVIRAVQNDLPFADRCWQFSPIGVRQLLLNDAYPDQVANYGEMVLRSLDQAAHPDPWPLHQRLHRIAKETLDYVLLSLREKGMLGSDIRLQLQKSAAFEYWQHYQGAFDRESQILNLKIQIGLAQTQDERWSLLRQLAYIMQGYEPNEATAAICRQGRVAGRCAHQAGYEISNLFYVEAVISEPQRALRLLNRGWRCLPVPICTEDMLTRFLEILRDPNNPQQAPLHRVLSRDVTLAMIHLIGGTGLVWNDLGEKWKALEYFEQALSLQRTVGNRTGEAITLSNIGLVWNDLGEKRKALEYFEQALSLQRTIGDRRGEATTLINAGNTWNDLGEKRKALEYFEQALSLQRIVGDRGGEATTLNNIGGLWSILEEKRKALEYFEQALSLQRTMGERRAEATTLTNVGRVWSDLGEKQKALVFYEQALPLHRAVGNRTGGAGALANMGRVWSDLGEKQKALVFYEQALPLYRAVGDRGGEAGVLADIGRVWSDLGEKRRALEYLEQALSLDRVVEDRGSEARTLTNIGYVWSDLEEKQRALEYLEQALSLHITVGSREGEATTLSNMARVWSDLGEKQKAISCLEQAIEVTIPNDPRLSYYHHTLASLKMGAEQEKDSPIEFEQAIERNGTTQHTQRDQISIEDTDLGEEFSMSDTNKSEFNNSGNIQGANINIGGTQSFKGNVTITMGNLTAKIQSGSAAPSDKEQLQKLIDELEAALKSVPAEHKANAELVSTRTTALVEEASASDVDPDSVKSKANRLKQAAENIKEVLPTVSLIAASIVTQVLRMGGM